MGEKRQTIMRWYDGEPFVDSKWKKDETTSTSRKFSVGKCKESEINKAYTFCAPSQPQCKYLCNDIPVWPVWIVYRMRKAPENNMNHKTTSCHFNHNICFSQFIRFPVWIFMLISSLLVNISHTFAYSVCIFLDQTIQLAGVFISYSVVSRLRQV